MVSERKRAHVMKRAEAIVAYLQSRDLSKADMIAEAIGCTQRTVFRYLARLRAEGWEIPAEAGVGIAGWRMKKAMPDGE